MAFAPTVACYHLPSPMDVRELPPELDGSG
jgi:hypothetical protein